MLEDPTASARTRTALAVALFALHLAFALALLATLLRLLFTKAVGGGGAGGRQRGGCVGRCSAACNCCQVRSVCPCCRRRSLTCVLPFHFRSATWRRRCRVHDARSRRGRRRGRLCADAFRLGLVALSFDGFPVLAQFYVPALDFCHPAFLIMRVGSRIMRTLCLAHIRGRCQTMLQFAFPTSSPLNKLHSSLRHSTHSRKRFNTGILWQESRASKNEREGNSLHEG